MGYSSPSKFELQHLSPGHMGSNALSPGCYNIQPEGSVGSSLSKTITAKKRKGLSNTYWQGACSMRISSLNRLGPVESQN